MFKAWFSRNASNQPAPPSSDVPRLTLAGDLSLPKRPEGPHVSVVYRHAAMILTAEVESIRSATLEDAVRRRAPDVSFTGPTKPGKYPLALGAYPDVVKAVKSGRKPLFCGIGYLPTIVPDLDQQSSVTTSWWWPEIREVVACAKAHAVTAFLGDVAQIPAKERILLEMRLVAAGLDVLTSAIAVVWPDANAMWKPDQFRSALDLAEGEIPVVLAVAVKLGRDTEHLHPDGTPTWFARTEGLNAFGIMEVEWRAFNGPYPELCEWVHGIACYLVNNGAIIADGDSMGSNEPGGLPSVFIRHEASTTVPGSRAYVIYRQASN